MTPTNSFKPVKKFAHNPTAVQHFKSITQFEVKPDASQPDEWFQLRSRALTAKQLFAMLQSIWPAMVATEPQKFALIHCVSGPHAGVWLHLLPSDDFEPGCHTVDSF